MMSQYLQGQECKVRFLKNEGKIQFATMFSSFKDSLCSVFQELRTSSFQVTWTDLNGNVRHVTNDAQLFIANTQMYDNIVYDVHMLNKTE